MPHQLCEFHVLKDLNLATLHAGAKVRKDLAAQLPKLGRGRPTTATCPLVQKRQRLQQKISDLVEYRYTCPGGNASARVSSCNTISRKWSEHQ